MTTKILHISPHLGGGVGSVLLNYLKYEVFNHSNNTHTVTTLDYANDKSKQVCSEYNINLYSDMYKKFNILLELIKNSDIVIIHFWNHPLLYDFLIRNHLPECRLIFWAHVSGFNPPYVFPNKILDMSDKFIFTTPISYRVKEIQDYQAKEKFTSILSTSGVEKYANIELTSHESFNVGYIGTVDYAKMHPEFIEICRNLEIPNIKFIVIGGEKENILISEAKKYDIYDKFNITGKVGDIIPYLSSFDVFAYPLNPNHYGTAEQVLQEAMAAGVVPVVMNNPAESYLVQHLKTGLIANNINEYCEFIELLYKNPNLKKQLSLNCKKYAEENFSLSNLADQWQKIFYEMLRTQKCKKRYSENKTYSYFDIFLESLGTHKEPFVLYLKNNNSELISEVLHQLEWQSESKGTLKQYNKFFDDKTIKKLMELYKE